MPQGKVYLDEQGNPIQTPARGRGAGPTTGQRPVGRGGMETAPTTPTTPQEYLDEEGNPIPQPGRGFNLWDELNAPIFNQPSEAARSKAQSMTDPRNKPTMWTGFRAGALEGLGDVISGLTSPLGLATAGVGAAEYTAGKAGFPAASRMLGYGTKALSAPYVVSGTMKALDPESTVTERLMGVGEAAGGAAGVFHTPAGKPPTRPGIKPSVASRVAGEKIPINLTDVTGAPIRPERMLGEDVPSNLKPNTGGPITPEEMARNKAKEFTVERRSTPRVQMNNPPKTLKEVVARAPEFGVDLTGLPKDEALLKLNDAVRANPKVAPLRDAYYDVLRAGKAPFKSEVQSGRIPSTAKLAEETPSTPRTELVDELPPSLKGEEWKNPYNKDMQPDLWKGAERMHQDVLRMQDERFRASQDPVKVAAQKARSDEWNRVQRNLEVTSILEKEHPPEVLKAMSQEEWDALHAKKMAELYPENTPAPQASLNRATGVAPDAPPSDSNVLRIRLKHATPENMAEAMRQGYTLEGLNDDGTARMVRSSTGAPKQVPILESQVPNERKGVGANRPSYGSGGQPPTVRPPGKEGPPGGGGKSPKPQGALDYATQAMNFPRAVMASLDFSAPLRQGLTLIHKKQFWTSLDDMFKAWGSEKAFKQIHDEIRSRPLFKERVNPKTGKPMPSFAEESGLKLTDLDGELSGREEQIMSKWAEKIPGVRRSNRAYTTFLNKLRADVFEDLVTKNPVIGKEAKANLPLAKALADFVNTASGRGSLGSLEKSAQVLNTVLFSPRLMASRLKLLNPRYYYLADPITRKEALKSLLALTAAGNTIVQLGKLAGGEVSNDPNSSDFGKVKIGNVRVDPFGGFQQYIVAANRLLRPSQDTLHEMGLPDEGTDTGFTPLDLATGYAAHGGQHFTSSTTGKDFDLWEKKEAFDPTHMDVASRFARGKLNPVLGFAWSLASGQRELTGEKMKFSPMNPFGDRGENIMDNAIAQRFIPIILQDLYQLSKEDSYLAPILGGLFAGFGGGIQNYESK